MGEFSEIPNVPMKKSVSSGQEIPPGTVRPVPTDHLPPSEAPQAKERKAKVHDDLVAKYRLFDTSVPDKRDVVYHPCSAEDMSPSIAFPDSRVVYVEMDEQAVKALRDAGQEAHHASATEFNPGAVDLLIMLNPQIPPEVPASHIAENGYALVNDYHGTASTLRRNPDFELQGIVRVTKAGLIYDTEHPEMYWEEVDTDEAWRAAPFSWGAANYLMAKPVVDAVFGDTENVLDSYKKIVEMAKQKRRESNAKMLQEHPEWSEFMLAQDDATDFMFNHEGKQFVVSASLPRKKGTVDDLFVFKKLPNPDIANPPIL